MKQLVLTAISSIWPTEGDLVLAGPWCDCKMTAEALAGVRAGGRKIECVPVNCEYSDYGHVHSHVARLWPELLPLLADVLNDYHGVAHTEEYWKSLLDLWFQDWFFNWFFAWKHMDRVLSSDAMGTDEVEVYLVKALTPQLPSSGMSLTGDIPEAIRYDVFHQLLFSEVLREMSEHRSRIHPVWTQIEGYHAPACRESSAGKHTDDLIHQVKHDIYRVTSKFAPVVAHGMRVSDGGRFIKETMGRVYYIESIDRSCSASYEASFRERLMNTATEYFRSCELRILHDVCEDELFEAFLLKRLILDLPVTMVEGYSEQKKKIRKLLRRRTPKMAVLKYGPTSEGILAATWREAGVSIAGRQDSVTPSLANLPWSSGIELYDRYYGWGSKSEYPNLYLSPTDRFDPSADSATGRAGILWCTSGAERRYPDFDGWLDAGCRREDYDKRLACFADFARGLSRKVSEEMFCRLRDPYGVGIREYIGEWNPGIRFDDHLVGEAVPQWSGGTLSERLYHTRLVVVNMLHTSVMFESLLRGTPVIIVGPYLKDYQLAFTWEGLLPYVERLRELGLWYEDGKAAAEFLNDNYDRIEEWWNEPDRRAFVREFAEAVYMPENDRTSWWTKELKL